MTEGDFDRHEETGEMVGDGVLHPRNVCNANMVFSPSREEEEGADQGHEVFALALAPLPYLYYGRIIAVEQDFFCVSTEHPRWRMQPR